MCTGTSQTDIQSCTSFEERRKEGGSKGGINGETETEKETKERKRNKERQARFSIPCRCFLNSFPMSLFITSLEKFRQEYHFVN